MVTIHQPELPQPVKNIEFPNDILISSFGQAQITIINETSVFIPASIKIKTPETVIYIDPLLISEREPADVILITHAHHDHLSLQDIQSILKEDTVVIGPKRAIEGLTGLNTKIVEPNQSIELANVKLETVPAYNLDPSYLWLKAHPPQHKNVGYVLNIQDLRIYHAGDTDLVPELWKIQDLDIAFLPVDEKKASLTMNLAQALEFCNKTKPKYVVPMHYKLNTNVLEDFQKGLKEGIQLISLE